MLGSCKTQYPTCFQFHLMKGGKSVITSKSTFHGCWLLVLTIYSTYLGLVYTQALTAEKQSNTVFNEAIIGIRLDGGFVIESRTARHSTECVQFCHRKPLCRSVNLCGKVMCQLNAIDVHHPDLNLLQNATVQDAHCQYRGMKKNDLPSCAQKGIASNGSCDEVAKYGYHWKNWTTTPIRTVELGPVFRHTFTRVCASKDDATVDNSKCDGSSIKIDEYNWGPWSSSRRVVESSDQREELVDRSCYLLNGSLVDNSKCSGDADSSKVVLSWKYFSTAKNYADAESLCTLHGGFVWGDVNGTEDQLSFFCEKLHSEKFWIGASDEGHEGKWINTQENDVTSLLRWAPGQPNAGVNENIVCVYSDRLVHDVNPYESFPFVCQMII